MNTKHKGGKRIRRSPRLPSATLALVLLLGAPCVSFAEGEPKPTPTPTRTLPPDQSSSTVATLLRDFRDNEEDLDNLRKQILDEHRIIDEVDSTIHSLRVTTMPLEIAPEIGAIKTSLGVPGGSGEMDLQKADDLLRKLQLIQEKFAAPLQSALLPLASERMHPRTEKGDQTARGVAGEAIAELDKQLGQMGAGLLAGKIQTGNTEQLAKVAAEAVQSFSDTKFTAIKNSLVAVLKKEIAELRDHATSIEQEIRLKEDQVAQRRGDFWRKYTDEKGKEERYHLLALYGFIAMTVVLLAAVFSVLISSRHAHRAGMLADFFRWSPLLDLSTAFILTFAIIMLGLNGKLSPEVLGTLLGGISGYVLGRAGRSASAAAERAEIKELVQSGRNPEAPRSLPVTATMIRADKLPPPETFGKPNKDILLTTLAAHLKKQKWDRILIFKDNDPGKGVVDAVLHLSLIESFQSAQNKPEGVPNLSLEDLKKDARIGKIFANSVAWINKVSTLSDAKAAMDSKSKSIGAEGNCYDVLITENGLSNETVLGWITNDVLSERAKV